MAIKLICRNDKADLTALFPQARVAGPSPGPVFAITMAREEPLAVLEEPYALPGPPLAVPVAPLAVPVAGPPVLIVCPQCGTSNVFDSNALPENERGSDRGSETIKITGDDELLDDDHF